MNLTKMKLITRSEEETFAAAKNLAKGFKGNEVVLLQGELGAGKTVFARGVAAGLDVEDITQVCSPSFTLINVYKARYPIIHMDLYRLGKSSEVYDLGWEDYLDQGVIIVEWAEKLDYDAAAIHVLIEVGENEERKISIEYR